MTVFQLKILFDKRPGSGNDGNIEPKKKPTKRSDYG